MRGIEIKTTSMNTLSDIVKERIDNFSLNIDIKKSGKILDSKYGVCKVYGLGNSQPGSIVKFEDITEGIVVNKELDDTVIVVLLGKEESIPEDVICTLTGKILITPYNNVCNQQEELKQLINEQITLTDFSNIIKKEEKHWVKLNNRFNKRKR